MRIYKCLWQTIDLDHVLAVGDIDDIFGWGVTLALHDKGLYFRLFDMPGYRALDYDRSREAEQNRMSNEWKQARIDLIAAWTAPAIKL